MIRTYEEDYVKFFPEEWFWDLDNHDDKSRDLYMHFRARKSPDVDKSPFFDSIEKDANRFNLSEITVTDFFGIKWKGKKGVHKCVGAPDYDQHLYYFDNDCEEYLVSDEYTRKEPPKGFLRVKRGVNFEWIDFDNIVDIHYSWILENHLFKDSVITVSYDGPIKLVNNSRFEPENKDINLVFDIYAFGRALKMSDKKELYEKFCAQVDEHLKALRRSTREEERHFAPVHYEGDSKIFSDADYIFDGTKVGVMQI